MRAQKKKKHALIRTVEQSAQSPETERDVVQQFHPSVGYEPGSASLVSAETNSIIGIAAPLTPYLLRGIHSLRLIIKNTPPDLIRSGSPLDISPHAQVRPSYRVSERVTRKMKTRESSYGGLMKN